MYINTLFTNSQIIQQLIKNVRFIFSTSSRQKLIQQSILEISKIILSIGVSQPKFCQQSQIIHIVRLFSFVKSVVKLVGVVKVWQKLLRGVRVIVVFVLTAIDRFWFLVVNVRYIVIFVDLFAKF